MKRHIIIEQTKHYHFWTSVLWMVFILGLFMLGQSVPILVSMLNEGIPFTKEGLKLFKVLMGNDVRLLFLSSLVGTAFVLPTIWFIITRMENSTLKESLYLNRTSFLNYMIWLLVLVLIFLAMGVLIQILGFSKTPDFMLNLQYPTLMHQILLLVTVVILAPIVEEVVFRGFLQKRFSGTFLGVDGAVFLTAFIWAVIHGQYESVYIFVIFLIGLVFGYARVITNSLYIPIMMHAVMNLWSVLGLFYEKGVF